MAISEPFAVSETIGTTEHSLTTDSSGPDVETSDGIFQAFLDLNALAAGDIFAFKVYEKIQSGSTQRLVFSATFAGVQGQPNWASPCLVLMHGWDMTLQKKSGTDRAIDTSIRKIA